jgi:GTP-binding protein
VRVEAERSFVVADVPGLIEGAAEGAGLGIRFLKHLTRTRLLLHLVDVAPLEGDPVAAVRQIEEELVKFDQGLSERVRWLVLNKIDLIAPAAVEPICEDIVRRLGWSGPVFRVSAATGAGTRELVQQVMTFLENHPVEPAPTQDEASTYDPLSEP